MSISSADGVEGLPASDASEEFWIVGVRGLVASDELRIRW
jgi:hypothetical protein